MNEINTSNLENKIEHELSQRLKLELSYVKNELQKIKNEIANNQEVITKKNKQIHDLNQQLDEISQKYNFEIDEYKSKIKKLQEMIDPPEPEASDTKTSKVLNWLGIQISEVN